MTHITDVWQALVRRRLWPVAVLLLGALVAVPMLLAKDPAPAPVPQGSSLPAGLTKGAGAETAKPVVSLADEGAARRRRVLGARKDPFQPAPVPRAAASDTAPADSNAGDSVPVTGGGSAAPDSSGSGGAPVTGGPGTTVAPPKKKTFPADSLTVRFSADGGESNKFVLETLQPLPRNTDGADSTAFLVYLGLVKGGKEAKFLVDASVTAQGDGRCESPSGNPDDCTTLYLRAGETEFLDIMDADGTTATAQYQFDLVSIHASKRAKAAKKAQLAVKVKRADTAVLRQSLNELSGVARLLRGL
jgi:hypothetical protein